MEEEKKEWYEELIDDIEEEIPKYDVENISDDDLVRLYKLIDIHKDLKNEKYWKEKIEIMRYGRSYGNYGNYGANFDNYRDGGESGGRGMYSRDYSGYGRGNSGNYGARGYDAKYRGYEGLDRMADEYGRYSENRERYGAGSETDKSFHYMVEAYKDFGKVLMEEAETPEQKQMLKQAMMM